MDIDHYRKLLANTSEKRISKSLLLNFMETEVYSVLCDTLELRVLLLREQYDHAETFDEINIIKGKIREASFLRYFFDTWLEALTEEEQNNEAE